MSRFNLVLFIKILKHSSGLCNTIILKAQRKAFQRSPVGAKMWNSHISVS